MHDRRQILFKLAALLVLPRAAVADKGKLDVIASMPSRAAGVSPNLRDPRIWDSVSFNLQPKARRGSANGSRQSRPLGAKLSGYRKAS